MNYVLAAILAITLLWLHPLKVEAPRSWYRPAPVPVKAVLQVDCVEAGRICRARTRLEKVKGTQ